MAMAMALQSNCSVGDDTNSKRRRSYDGDDRLEELERSEEILREQLKNLRRFNYKCKIQFEDVESELMQVRTQLKCVEKGRAKLADLEFDIFSPTIIRKKITEIALICLHGLKQYVAVQRAEKAETMRIDLRCVGPIKFCSLFAVSLATVKTIRP